MGKEKRRELLQLCTQEEGLEEIRGRAISTIDKREFGKKEGHSTRPIKARQISYESIAYAIRKPYGRRRYQSKAKAFLGTSNHHNPLRIFHEVYLPNRNSRYELGVLRKAY